MAAWAAIVCLITQLSWRSFIQRIERGNATNTAKPNNPPQMRRQSRL